VNPETTGDDLIMGCEPRETWPMKPICQGQVTVHPFSDVGTQAENFEKEFG